MAEQLTRILATPHFASSPRSSRFLRYVVETTLAGREDEIKEVVIALELYNRSTDYDPKVDSTVRVEATRVRAKLERYYATLGADDPVHIVIPKGTYVPRFVPPEDGSAGPDAIREPELEPVEARVRIAWRALA